MKLSTNESQASTFLDQSEWTRLTLVLQLTEGGLTGTPGVPVKLLEPPVVREFRSVGGNVQSRHPGMEEPTALARCSETDPVTLDLVIQVRFYSSLSIL